jgi:hypothetical protein
MRRVLLAVACSIAFTFAATPAVFAKTEKECDAEYKANKEAIKGSGQKKKNFIAACRAGTETIPTGTSDNPPPPPSPSPAPSPAPPPKSSEGPAPSPRQNIGRPTPTGANEFATEAQAKARCPGATVVWVNTRSGVYHFAGTHSYGKTKDGAYMCESDATAAGFRAAKDEKHS